MMTQQNLSSPIQPEGKTSVSKWKILEFPETEKKCDCQNHILIYKKLSSMNYFGFAGVQKMKQPSLMILNVYGSILLPKSNLCFEPSKKGRKKTAQR
jgi:hypothetical protein